MARDGWLGYAPAAPEAVAAAEARLGVRLPPSYRDFLLTTDGWRDAGMFVSQMRGTSSVGWLADIESFWAEGWDEDLEDAAMELILRECGRDHDFPRVSLEITETVTDRDGHLVNVNRAACRKCGTLKVTRWRAPDPGTSPRFLSAIGTFERPQPADVPGLAQRAALITE